MKNNSRWLSNKTLVDISVCVLCVGVCVCVFELAHGLLLVVSWSTQGAVWCARSVSIHRRLSHRSGSCGARKDPCTLGISIGGASEGIGDACYCTARMCAMATQAVEEAHAPRSFGHQKFPILDQIFCRTIKLDECNRKMDTGLPVFQLCKGWRLCS
jgi:hypothetical protein